MDGSGGIRFSLRPLGPCSPFLLGNDVGMTIRDQDLQILNALEAAWQQRKELTDLLRFYYDLYELQFRVKAEATDPEVRDEMARRWRLEGGIPQLTFDQLRLEAEPFGHLVAEISHLFSLHDYPALGVEEGEHAPGELVPWLNRPLTRGTRSRCLGPADRVWLAVQRLWRWVLPWPRTSSGPPRRFCLISI